MESKNKTIMKHSILITVFILSITANMIFYIISIHPLVRERLCKDEYINQITVDNYKTKIIDAALKMCASNKDVIPVNNHNDFYSGLRSIIDKRSSINFTHKAFLLKGLVDYGISNNDTSLLINIKRILKKHTKNDGSLNFKLEYLDQAAFGTVLIDLDNYYGKSEYKKGINEIYDFLKQNIIPGTNLIIYRPNDTRQFIDALGVICPLLIKYGVSYNDSAALSLAYQQILFYIKNGIDTRSHFPFHAVNIKNNLCLGPSTWGRGIGWYSLALAETLKYTNVNNNPYYTMFCEEMAILYSNLMTLRVNNYWGQFISGNAADRIDTSTTTMILYAFTLFGYKPYSQYEVIELFKNYTTNKGYLDFTSGDAADINGYSTEVGKSEISQGMLLSLLSLYN